MSDKQLAKDLLASHGPRRWIYGWLYRLRMMGWVFFSITLLYLIIMHTVSVAFPRPVLVVDQLGNPVGQIDFYDKLTRSNFDYTTAAMHALSCKLSMNSETIMNDVKCWLDMVDQHTGLYKSETQKIASDPSFYEISQAKMRSRLEYDRDEDAPRVVSRQGKTVFVRLTGKRVVYRKAKTEQRFDTTIGLKAVPRNGQNTFGIEVVSLDDN